MSAPLLQCFFVKYWEFLSWDFNFFWSLGGAKQAIGPYMKQPGFIEWPWRSRKSSTFPEVLHYLTSFLTD